MLVTCRFASSTGHLRLSRTLSVETNNDLFLIEHAVYALARSLFQMDWKYLRASFETFDGSYSLSAEREAIYSGGQGR